MFRFLGTLWDRLAGRGGGSGLTTTRVPLLPAWQTGGDITKAFGPAALQDVVLSDLWWQPWRGPIDTDRDGNETPEMRLKYREVFRREPVVRSAVRGKANAVASLDFSVIPASKSPLDGMVAEFVKYALDSSDHGAHGLVRNIVQPALIDGFSLCEKRLEVIRSGKWKGKWGLKHARQLDTQHLRLQLDEFRNVLGVVNLLRGVQVYDPAKTILFTYSGMYSNPFGQSDLRACYRSVGLIEDAYKCWYVAIKRFGLPYMVGKVDKPTSRKMMEDVLKELIAGGYVVIGTEDQIELLNLASSAGFSEFESKVNKLREEIMLAIRGAYLPFLEGQGGTDAHGDTSIHKIASDADEYLLAKDVALAINQQLVPDLVYPNFGEEYDLPRVVLGGTNWAETKAQLEVGAMILTQFRQPISRAQLYEVAQWSPPEGDADAVQPPDMGGGGGGGGMFGGLLGGGDAGGGATGGGTGGGEWSGPAASSAPAVAAASANSSGDTPPPPAQSSEAAAAGAGGGTRPPAIPSEPREEDGLSEEPAGFSATDLQGLGPERLGPLVREVVDECLDECLDELIREVID